MFNYSYITAEGSRAKNEDSVICAENGTDRFFVLCDGMGGHGLGGEASAAVTQSSKELFDSGLRGEELLRESFDKAQRCLLRMQSDQNAHSGLRTTAVMLSIGRRRACYGHIGDSRLYIFDKHGLKLRTRDHSVPEMLFRSGEISEGEIRFHEDRSRVLRALGSEWEKPMYEIADPLPLRECRAFLLCTDGFWEYIEDAEMVSTLYSAPDAHSWLEQMTLRVRRNGRGRKMDNFSAIAVWL